MKIIDLKVFLKKMESKFGPIDSWDIELMIETQSCQYQSRMNDVAVANRYSGQGYIVLMHEKRLSSDPFGKPK